MIYTVTFNPSLDYVVQADQLIPGEINRTTSEHIYPGGKGNNVSVILSNLGLKSKALGFKAGFTGDVLYRKSVTDSKILFHSFHMPVSLLHEDYCLTPRLPQLQTY